MAYCGKEHLENDYSNDETELNRGASRKQIPISFYVICSAVRGALLSSMEMPESKAKSSF